VRVVVVIQARMGSTRLPGKVLLPLAGTPLVWHVVDRARRIARVDHVLVATPTGAEDDPLVSYLEDAAIAVFRGSEADVLDRYLRAAEDAGAEVIIRITADCPLISPMVASTVVARFLDASPPVDYASNSHPLTYPRGLDTEVFSVDALRRAATEADSEPEREHVTLHLYRHPERFRLLSVTDEVDRSDLRWTVDTPEDYALVSRIFDALYPTNPRFDLPDVLEVLEAHPDWAALNRDVAQKEVGE
jgi:spore coat polysaccharide biosynthesis protein SpsF